jgi:GNAT superfamily N-acetyltransferase
VSDRARLRPIRETDLPACVAVFYASMEHLQASRSEPSWPRNEVSLQRLLARLVASQAPGCWIAEDASGSPVGFVVAVERERLWFLAFLFVLPGHQSAGLGRRLLEKAFPDGGPASWLAGGGVLATCAEATQPIAMRLYADHGLLPRTPIHLLIGRPRPGALAELPAGVEAVAFTSLEASGGESALAAALDELDLLAVGQRRALDHRDDRAEGRQGWLYRAVSGDRPLGYGYAAASGRLGPVAAVEGALLEGIVGHLMGAVVPAGGWQLVVPGPSAALPAFLRAGLRFDGAPELLCSTAPFLAADRYLLRSLALP